MTTREEVQYSLCWNNFNANMSTGLYDSLCRDDLVDVTLAADGHLARAHRLVLSLSSPYFQKMFTQMPVNQQAFVLLHDCPHTVLKDLIQFMYCGEVNVAPEDLPAFLKVAEGLQIKGLMENADSTTTAEVQVPSSATNDMHGFIGAIDPMASVPPAEIINQTIMPNYQTPTNLGNSTTVTKRTRKRVSEPIPTTGAARTTVNNRRTSKRQRKSTAPWSPSPPDNQHEHENEEEDEENGDEEEEEEEQENESEDNETGDEEYVEDEYNGTNDGTLNASGSRQSYTEADTSVNSSGKANRSSVGRRRLPKSAPHKPSSSSHEVEFISGPTNRILLVDQYKFYQTKGGRNNLAWFCRLKQQLGCPARVRTNLDGGDIEFIDLNHNHGVGTFAGRGRALKASLEAVYVKQEPEDKN